MVISNHFPMEMIWFIDGQPIHEVLVEATRQFTTGFSTIPGGWPWDFKKTINSTFAHIFDELSFCLVAKQ